MTQSIGGTLERRVLVLLLVTAGIVLVGLAVTGTAAAQSSNSVDVEDTIYTDQESFTASYEASDSGCLRIFKNDNQLDERSISSGSGSITVDQTDVQGWNSGDELAVDLYLNCNNYVTKDDTIVTQTGTVDVDDTIYADQSEFQVTVTELRIDRSFGCVAVRKSGGQTVQKTVQEGDTVSISEDEVGSFRSGDVISADLIDDGKTCDGELLDTDSTDVTATGDLSIEDPIYADQTQFEVDVTEVRTNDGQACVGIYQDGELLAGKTGIESGDTIVFTEDDVGEIANGDEFTARLLNFCEEELATDSTTVTQTGSVDLEDSIHGAQDQFEVTVTELRVDNPPGCVRVSSRIGGDTEATSVSEGETRQIAASDVGGIEEGDLLSATLIDDANCDGTGLADDSTTVSEAETPTPTATFTPTPTPTATPEPTPTPTEADGSDGDGGSEGGDARFEVTIDEVRVSDEGILVVNATIENTGGTADTQTVVFTVDGEDRDSSEVTLEPSESLSVRFTDDEPSEAQQRNIEVASEDDADEEAVTNEGTDGGLLPALGDSSGLLLLLLLLLALLLAYYYVRRRRYRTDRVPTGDEGD